MTLTFDLPTPKSIEVFYYSVPTSTSSFKTIGPSVPKLLVKQAFVIKVPVTLTFDLPTSKSLWVFCYSLPTSKLSFNTIGPSVP